MDHTYTVQTLSDASVIMKTGDLGAAITAFEGAWEDPCRGAIILDDLDGQPACLIRLELGCGCGRCEMTSARYVTDEYPDDPFTYESMIEANQDSPLDEADLEAIRGLDIGESVTLDYGAGGLTTFTRVADDEPCPRRRPPAPRPS